MFKKRGKKAKRQKGEEEKKLGTWEDKKIGSSQLLNFLTSQLPICLFTILPFLAGCAGVRPSPPVSNFETNWMLQRPSGTVKNLSLERIKDTLGSDSAKFTTLKAKAQITVNAPAFDGPLFCDGYIRLQRPNKLRVIGAKLTSTVFDMLTDRETFWLYLPSEKKVYTGKCNSMHRLVKLDVHIFPDDIAMLLDYNNALTPGASLTEGVNKTLIMETWPGLWLIHLVEINNKAATLRANLYIDRIGVNVIRYDIFDTNGNIRVQALFDDYARFDNSAIPQRIAISWPGVDTKLTLSLTNIAANEQIDPKVFQFSKPKKAEIISLDNM